MAIFIQLLAIAVTIYFDFQLFKTTIEDALSILKMNTLY